MARILIVEDDEHRRSWFDLHFAGHEIHTTADVAVAVDWLLKHQYDLIFLDHDLAVDHYAQEMADDGLTGYAVALWLSQHPECQPTVDIIIHSLNFPGSDRMRSCLEKAGRPAQHVPFPYLPALFVRSP